MIQLLHTYRGFAALIVVLFHASSISTSYFGYHPANGQFFFGSVGVQFFFVLSGFIMMHIHQDDISRPERSLRFISKRIKRIYPAYIVLCLPLFAITVLWQGISNTSSDLKSFLLSLLLIPHDKDLFLGVAWTLCHEMLFYLVFTTLILSRKAGLLIFVVWTVLCIAVNAEYSPADSFPGNFFFSTYNLLFMLGMLTKVLTESPWVRAHLNQATFVLANILFVLACAWLNWQIQEKLINGYDLIIILFGLTSALILLHTPLELPLLKQRAFNLLGDASYSLYLVHYPVLSILCKLIAHVAPDAHPVLVFTLGAITATLAGIAFHKVIERPLARALR